MSFWQKGLLQNYVPFGSADGAAREARVPVVQLLLDGAFVGRFRAFSLDSPLAGGRIL